MRARLGAEELIELGQAEEVLPAPEASASVRSVSISRAEAELLVRTVESIISFAKGFPFEFHSFCPAERWQPTLATVGRGVQDVERQLSSGRGEIIVPAAVVFGTVDLEECVSGARDARLGSAKTALGISAAGAIAQTVFGLKWVALPAYLISLAVVLGRPLATKAKAAPGEPFEPNVVLEGSALGSCPNAARDVPPGMPKFIERVIVCPKDRVQRHHWGSVRPRFGPIEACTCLSNGKWRVRVEGWEGDDVAPADGWRRVSIAECRAAVEVGVWEPASEDPRRTAWGRIPEGTRQDGSYWIEYTGPRTDGVVRRAGPFGCDGDTVEHALDDGAIVQPGVDGGYVLLDADGNAIKEAV